MPYLRLHRADAAAGGQPGDPILFTAATAGMKGDGVDLADLPWDFSRGRVDAGASGPRVPFLWVHNMRGDYLPLGVTEVRSAEGELPLKIAVYFDSAEDEMAARVERKYRSAVGGLDAVSVSWDDVDASGVPARASGKKPVAHQLLEVSAVPVGMDPGALQEGTRLGLRALQADIEAALGEDAPLTAGGGASKRTRKGGTVSTRPPQRALLGSWEDDSDEILEAIRDSGWFGSSYIWVLGTFDENIVICVYPPDGGTGTYYQIPYTTDAAGVITLGAMKEVDIAQVVVSEDDTGARSADEALWFDAAAAMVDVFDRGAVDSDEKRRRRYNALRQSYRQLAKEPPEFLGGVELAVLDDENWRALFVAGELDVLARAGKELSTRNMTELREIHDNVVGEIKRLRSLLDRVDTAGGGAADETKTDEKGGNRATRPDFFGALRSALEVTK